MTSRNALALGEEHRDADVPSIGPGGLLTFRNRSVFLSEHNALLAIVFVYYFGSLLTDLELLDRVWPEGATRSTVRMCLRQLDRQLATIGLTIADVGEHSHVMRVCDQAACR